MHHHPSLLASHYPSISFYVGYYTWPVPIRPVVYYITISQKKKTADNIHIAGQVTALLKSKARGSVPV